MGAVEVVDRRLHLREGDRLSRALEHRRRGRRPRSWRRSTTTRPPHPRATGRRSGRGAGEAGGASLKRGASLCCAQRAAFPLTLLRDPRTALADPVDRIAGPASRRGCPVHCRLPWTVVCEIVLPVPALFVNWRFPPTVVGPAAADAPRRAGGAARDLQVAGDLAVADRRSRPSSSRRRRRSCSVSCTLPLTVEPASRRPLPLVIWTLPFTVTSTRSHQLPVRHRQVAVDRGGVELAVRAGDVPVGALERRLQRQAATARRRRRPRASARRSRAPTAAWLSDQYES